MSKSTDPAASPLSPAWYTELSSEDLERELVSTCLRLAQAHNELSTVKAHRLYMHWQGYQAAIHETSHAARDAQAQMAALPLYEDELTLEGNIASLLVMRDLLVELRAR